MIKISSQIGNLLFEQDVLDPRILFFCTDGLVAQEVGVVGARIYRSQSDWVQSVEGPGRQRVVPW